MTRLLVFSDLHLEHASSWALPETFPPSDVVVLAGDIDAPPERAIRRLTEAPGLAGRPIVYVPGNHEFYGGIMGERVEAGKAACADGRIHLLDRDAVVLAGVRFVGATLWTDYRLHGDAAAAMAACRRKLPDHRRIEVGDRGLRRLLQPRDAAALHSADRSYIEAELGRPCDRPTVVVTHHAPAPGCVPTRFACDRTTPGYASDLTDVMRRGRPALWIHGHLHASNDHRVADTRVVANPRGYDRRGGAENANFDPYLIVEVPARGRS